MESNPITKRGVEKEEEERLSEGATMGIAGGTGGSLVAGGVLVRGAGGGGAF
ncbi:hypothetical protein F2Q70_00041576 [Brassica cretica]|uniref:Uncharacterized protein n=1 Tax=Brassica cretica TaxID=69181 RepID=A0A8S9KAX1_BRACR|nr:hypothetical protein F2Q70_00041576 [Brassica cretica]